MDEARVDAVATASDGRSGGPIAYLVAHPTVRVMCEAAAFATSLYAIRQSVRPTTKLNRAAWTALAALTAVEGAGLLAFLPGGLVPRLNTRRATA